MKRNPRWGNASLGPASDPECGRLQGVYLGGGEVTLAERLLAVRDMEPEVGTSCSLCSPGTYRH